MLHLILMRPHQSTIEMISLAWRVWVCVARFEIYVNCVNMNSKFINDCVAACDCDTRSARDA
jgi:hypothetical protein